MVCSLYVAMIFGLARLMNVLCGNKDMFESEMTSYEDPRSSTIRSPCHCKLNQLDKDPISNETVICNQNLTASKENFEFVSKCDNSRPVNVNDTFTPRLGDKITMAVYAEGNSSPRFIWCHNGRFLNSSILKCSSSITVRITEASDFGEYTVDMKQGKTHYLSTFHVLAEGPPEPVSDLNVFNVSTTSVLVSFLTGYNYKSNQTFIIMTYLDGHRTELSSCLDTTFGDGGKTFTCAVGNLSEDTLYKITVVSNNSRGESKPCNVFVTFTTYGTPKPDPAKTDTDTFKPRIPDVVTMTIHAVGYPPPRYEWWHNGARLNSSDTNYTSTVTVRILEPVDFGKYMLNMTNEVGQFTKVYMVVADGPPAAVSNLDVSNITENSANMTFTSGYDYNDTQTFVVQNYTKGNATELASVKGATHDDGGTTVRIIINELKPVSKYNITVVANNSRGQSKPVDAFWYFETLGTPAPDPGNKDNLTATPRLGSNVTLMFHAVGNPLPRFQWYHDNKPLGNASTGNMTSLTLEDFKVSDFGTYLLNMRNNLGETNVTFNVTTNGPPDPVTDLVAGEVNSDSVELYWRPGFNYGSDQTFTIFQVGNDKELRNNIEDQTKGNFSMNETFTLTGLSSSCTYIISVMASNVHGKASQPSNSINFTTSGENQISSTGLIIIAVAAGIIVVFLVIFAVVWYLKTKRRTLITLLEHDDMTSNGDTENPDLYGKDESKAVNEPTSKIHNYGAVSGMIPKTASSCGAVSGQRIKV